MALKIITVIMRLKAKIMTKVEIIIVSHNYGNFFILLTIMKENIYKKEK